MKKIIALMLFLTFFAHANDSEPGSQYLKAAEAGDRRAQYFLADSWFSSGDLSKAEYWAQKAADSGDADACALLAQITRHRIASFSVQSQRYVGQSGEDGIDYILPPEIEKLGDEYAKRFADQMDMMDKWYREWLELLGEGGKEDARFVLPNAAATRMVVTMNARELNHFFALRCCNRAQWEIRDVAWQMLKLAHEAAPALFDECGPECLRGRCPEGKMCCGRMDEVRARYDREIAGKPEA